MLAPLGNPASKLKVLVLAGRSGSVAVAVKVNGASSFTAVGKVGSVSTGGRFTSFTVTVKLFVLRITGTPLSVATTRIV